MNIKWNTNYVSKIKISKSHSNFFVQFLQSFMDPQSHMDPQRFWIWKIWVFFSKFYVFFQISFFRKINDNNIHSKVSSNLILHILVYKLTHIRKKKFCVQEIFNQKVQKTKIFSNIGRFIY